MSSENNSNPPFSPINREDGTRIWHPAVSTRTNLETNSGVYVWVGSQALKQPLLKEPPDNSQHSGLLTPADYFNNLGDCLQTRIGLFTYWEKQNYWLISKQTGKTTHNVEYSCGEYWLGIARLPLPPDFSRSDCWWPGWQHLVHWFPEINEKLHPGHSNQHFSHRFCRECPMVWAFSEKMPPPEKIFDFVVDTLEDSYPQDLQALSKLIINQFRIPAKKLPNEVVSAHFPHLDPIVINDGAWML